MAGQPGRTDGRRTPKEPPNDPGRNMHPNAKVSHQDAPRYDPCRPGRPESKSGSDKGR
jgi:hypothetical protein